MVFNKGDVLYVANVESLEYYKTEDEDDMEIIRLAFKIHMDEHKVTSKFFRKSIFHSLPPQEQTFIDGERVYCMEEASIKYSKSHNTAYKKAIGQCKKEIVAWRKDAKNGGCGLFSVKECEKYVAMYGHAIVSLRKKIKKEKT